MPPVTLTYVPVAQLVQTEDPALDAYFPAPQSAQVVTPTGAENLPVVVQLVQTVDPALDAYLYLA